MSSVDDSTTVYEHRDVGKEVMNHLKTFCFFVYYERRHVRGEPGKTNLDVGLIPA
jgi:hypothetical protein